MEKEKGQMLFMNLVTMLHALAWQQMGKMKNPLTDKVEVNLEGARNFIDSLEMLHQKTNGNLSPEEERLLSDLLKELRLNYIDELHKQEKEPLTGNRTEQEGGNLNQ
jgi:hypothetical protein